jgi:hypothetical protein
MDLFVSNLVKKSLHTQNSFCILELKSDAKTTWVARLLVGMPILKQESEYAKELIDKSPILWYIYCIQSGGPYIRAPPFFELWNVSSNVLLISRLLMSILGCCSMREGTKDLNNKGSLDILNALTGASKLITVNKINLIL